jgi:bacillithiol synthase
MECHCIAYTKLPEASALYTNYLYHFGRVAAFYGGGSPFSLASYQNVSRTVDYSPARRSEIVQILTRQNEAFGSGETARDNLRQLSRPGTLAVVTGQQVGFFSGPAFTLYKALTAVRLTQWLSERGIPSVPVFWLATEDHDLEEVSSIRVLDGDYNGVPLSDPGVRPAPQSSVGYVRLSEGVTTALAGLESVLPPGEARDQLLGDLRDSYGPGAGWGEAFAKFIARIFKRWGVILLDALDPDLHRLVAPAYVKAIEAAPDLTARLMKRSQDLVDAGFHAQVHVGPESTLIFGAREGNRLPLRSADSGRSFKLEGGSRFTQEELKQWTETRPEELTPNALFRPVVQDLLLPTVAYVAGPAELAYHAQSAVLYPAFERPQPVIVPRASFTLIDPRTERLLNKYHLAVDDAWQGEAHLRQRIAAVGFSEGWEERLGESEREIANILERLRGDVQSIDPTLLHAFERARKRTEYQFERLKGKITRAAFASSEVLRRHEQALTRFLTPDGHPQERGLGGVYFLGRAGYDLLDRLLNLISIEAPDHRVVPFHYTLA